MVACMEKNLLLKMQIIKMLSVVIFVSAPLLWLSDDVKSVPTSKRHRPLGY